MNIIEDSYIRSYCLGKFRTDYRLSSDGNELVIPSIFIEGDYKRHMSINLETGLWRCFKTGESGNFIKLYAKLENCSYSKAYEHFVFETFLEEERKPVPKEFVLNDSDLNPKCRLVNINDRTTNDPLNFAAYNFLSEKGMLDHSMYICDYGFYYGRLIIPFLKDSGGMFYFQARSLIPGLEPKYLNCRSVRSSSILYPFDYGSKEDLWITEGVFDCLALRQLGVKNSTSTLSCVVSNEQLQQLKQYQGKIVVAFDSDDAGIKGIRKFLKLALKHKMENLYYAIPPVGVKDWNDLSIQKGTLPQIRELNHINMELEAYDMMNEK